MSMFRRTLTRAATVAAAVAGGAAIAAAGPLAASAAADPGQAASPVDAQAAGVVDAGATGVAADGSLDAGSLGLGSAIGSVGPLGVVDTQSLGIGKDAADLEIVQNDGKVMRVKVHNPKGFTGVCTPVMADASRSVELISDPESLLKGGTGITLFHPFNFQGTWNSVGYPAPGIHALAVVCGGLGASDMSVTLVPVPGTTLGSMEGMFDFGSTIGSAMLGSVGGSLGS